MSVCLCVCLLTICEPGAHRGQKGELDPLDLELQIDGCEPHVGAGNGLRSERATRSLSH